jgi:hypothetical protein
MRHSSAWLASAHDAALTMPSSDGDEAANPTLLGIGC